MSSNFDGFIEYHFAGYGCFVFSGVSFPGTEEPADVDGDVLDAYTGMMDLVLGMKAPVFRFVQTVFQPGLNFVLDSASDGFPMILPYCVGFFIRMDF